MGTPTRQHTIETSHGSLAVEETGQGSIPVLLIHGNSTHHGVFRHQMQGQIAENHHLIALDLPGHGQSSNAPDPTRTYTRPGLAQSVIELLEEMGISEVIVFGWSLGGHIGMEMIPHFPGMRGLITTGAPPVSGNNMAQGFNSSPQMGAAGKQDLTEAEIQAFVQGLFGDSAEPFMFEAVARTDGRFRKRLFEAARAGEGTDQRQTVETSPVPLAIVNGADDPIIKLDYFDTIPYANLWEGRCHRISGAGHTAFWKAADKFDPILDRFLRHIETGKAPLKP